MRYYVIKVGRTPLKTLKIGGLIDQKVSQMTIKRRFIAGAKCLVMMSGLNASNVDIAKIVRPILMNHSYQK